MLIISNDNVDATQITIQFFYCTANDSIVTIRSERFQQEKRKTDVHQHDETYSADLFLF